MPGRPEQPLLLAGTGTGLAPLYGVARDALEAGHTGPVRLFHGALEVRGLYLVEALRALIRAECPHPVGWRAYLCGNPERVLSLKKKLFLAGLSLKDLHADAFLPSAGPGEGAGATHAPHPSR